jgi:M6 family metalloprotease-like protein
MGRSPTIAVGLLLISSVVLADSLMPATVYDLAAYKTVDTAIVTAISGDAKRTALITPAYLGVRLNRDASSKLTIADVDLDSPAARAGLNRGDVLLTLGGQPIKDEEGVNEILRARSVGETLLLELSRQGKPVSLNVLLGSWSRPFSGPGRIRDPLGVRVGASKDGHGVVIEEVLPDSVAARAKLKTGEVILKLGDVTVTGPDQFSDLLAARTAGETLPLTLFLAEKSLEIKLALDADGTAGRPTSGARAGFGGRGGRYWAKPSFRLALICVEYPDVKHNPKITKAAWEESLFSRRSVTKTNATGQAVFGSVYDYYFEQSYGTFKVEGKVFDWVEVSKKRADYATGNRTALLTEALDKIVARDGKNALKDCDGVFFLYAGARFPAARGSLYWAHRASVSHAGRRWPYFICDEGGPRMQNISVFCHEFGHMLGLPDLYARPENPGMEGVGVWCAMSQQQGRGKPQHFCAWSKEKLGWVKPAVIDPTVKQKLVLAPIEGSPKECFKVLIRRDGSEYLLLENRRKKGFDESLPAEGLLIWRVVGNRPSLKESHGVEGPAGPRVLPSEVPYPTAANDAFTPYTTPSSRAPNEEGPPVHITNIRRLADGRITFQIGYEYQ